MSLKFVARIARLGQQPEFPSGLPGPAFSRVDGPDFGNNPSRWLENRLAQFSGVAEGFLPCLAYVSTKFRSFQVIGRLDSNVANPIPAALQNSSRIG